MAYGCAMQTLFDPLQVGDMQLASRVVMAPLTRNRASPGQVPNDLMRQYYVQRANPATGAGLIITEATQISPMGQGYLDTPGLHSAEQVAAWRRITDAVHAVGGRIVVQLWHVGRISHTSLLPGGQAPVSPTAKPASGKTYIAGGFAPVSAPRALLTDEISAVVADYRQAAVNAMAAGFDGVEVHAANGYLIDQFLRDSINDRTDRYGGSIENRARFLVEVMQAVTSAIGGGRTGIRLSPLTPSNGAGMDSDPQALMSHVLAQLAPLQLAYVHVIEGQTGGAREVPDAPPFDYGRMKTEYQRGQPKGVWMVNNGYTADMAQRSVADGTADLVAFGKPFIANPDLGHRLKVGAAWNALDTSTLYGGTDKGYTDYPALA
jgi:N-ethylmaleimide reductase